MKIRIPHALIFAVLLLAGCGQKENLTASAPAAPAAPAAAAPAAAAGPREIDITANDTMKYIIAGKESGPAANLTIEAKAGEQLKVVLTNSGTLPKEAMGHNWVLLKPGTDVAAFSAAAAVAKDKDYIPDALKDSIVAKIDLLGPRKSGEATFSVPAGEYPFLCTFPAHYQIGMKGTLVVK